MKHLITVSILFMGILALGYKPDDHKHIWVMPVSDTVRIEQPNYSLVYTPGPSGWQEGGEMVCLKCFARKQQMVDYGPPEYMNIPQMPLNLDTINTNVLLKAK